MVTVKSRRSYDSSGRRRRAEEAREAVLSAAATLFQERGYAGTSVSDIAAAAGVSAETVYKSFGPKPAIVRALWLRGLGGRGPAPASERSDALSAEARDPRAVVRGWAQLATEVAPAVSPILLLIRDAAASEPDMRRLLDEVEAQRRQRMRHNARVLQRNGWLRPGLTLRHATDLLWLHSSPELYELLVVKSGWSLRRYGAWVGDSMIAALLEP